MANVFPGYMFLHGHHDATSSSQTFIYHPSPDRLAQFEIRATFSEFTTPSLREYEDATTMLEISADQPPSRDELLGRVRKSHRLVLLPFMATIDAIMESEEAKVEGGHVSLREVLECPFFVLVYPSSDGGVEVVGKSRCPAFRIEVHPKDSVCTQVGGSVPLLRAQDIVFPGGLDRNHLVVAQRMVQIPTGAAQDEGSPGSKNAFLKLPFSGHAEEISRELAILLSLHEPLHQGVQPIASLGHRVPKVLGLAGSSRGEHVVGLLLEWIDGRQLSDVSKDDFRQHGFKWRRQTEAFLTELHARGWAWGDVNAGSIMIDERGDAWAVDFGGRDHVIYKTVPFEELKRTDWEELRTVFEGIGIIGHG